MGSTSRLLGFGLVAAAVLATPLLAPSQLAAQSAQQVVDDLNRDAMEAYNGLDIDKAGSMLEEALRVAYEGGVTGPSLSRTNLNLGIVYIGGLGDNDTGLSYFTQAVCIDPSVQLDPLTSTPDIQSVFQVAQQQAQSGACPAGGGAAPATGPAQPAGPPGVAPAQPTYAQPVAPPPDQAIMHVSPAEQLAQTPLPIYVEVHPMAQAKKVFLYYKGLGMESFKRVPMYRYQGGMAYQVSCSDVWEPKLEYYIEAQSEDGRVVGVIASAAQPVQVPIVGARTQGEPALPGAPPPAACGAQECPPGVKGCEKRGKSGIEERCGGDAECQSGLECRGGSCMLLGGSGTELPDYDPMTGTFEEVEEPEIDDPSQFQPFFVQAGITVGMAYVTSGMVADRPAPDNRVFVDQFGEYVEDPISFYSSGGMLFFPEAGNETAEKLTAWVPDSDSADSISDLGGNCGGDGVFSGPNEFDFTGDPNALFPSKYCVRVKSPGFVPHVALRFGAGYFFTDRIAASVIGRLALASGEGSFAGMLVGARGEYMLTTPKSKGLMISAFAGGTFGQIQVQPPADGNTEGAPFIKSGLMGGHVGANFRYRISKNFGFYAGPELDVQFPTLLFNVDLTLAGLEGAFGGP